MSRKSDNIIKELDLTAKRLGRELNIVETGTIRKTAEEYIEGDGHSTASIAQWVRDNGGDFTSIDLETRTAIKHLSDMGLIEYVKLIKGYSTKVLNSIDKIDFAYLDSENDAMLTFEEFVIVWDKITDGGCIMIDDCNIASRELKKGDFVIPYLQDNGIEYTHYSTNQIAICRKERR